MKITDTIIYAGVNDRTIDLFESQYRVPEGMSYNSYVILDEKIAIMDTVDKRATDEWVKNIRNILGDKKPDYLVVSHMEPDHAANIKTLCDMYPAMKLVGNAKTFAFIEQFFDIEGLEEKKEVVAEGGELSLGSHTLAFYMAPMVHWPEVMVVYEKSEKVLFSADAFGKFGCIDDEDGDWECEAARYYFNIVGKYGVQVQALLKKAAGLDIRVICPLHGPVLKDNLSFYIDTYTKWSSYEAQKEGVLIAYASIHGNTEEAALTLAKLLRDKGAEVSVKDLARDDMAEVVEDAFVYKKIVLAAATYDGGCFLPMEDFLHHLKSKNLQKRKIALIENGTWAPMAAKVMRTTVEGFKDMEVIEPAVTIKSVMKEADVRAIEELAEKLG